jgi:hypothetical protein
MAPAMAKIYIYIYLYLHMQKKMPDVLVEEWHGSESGAMPCCSFQQE